MKSKKWLIFLFAFTFIGASVPLAAQPARQPSAIEKSVMTVVEKLQKKLQDSQTSGAPVTESMLSSELKELDDIIAANKGAGQEDLAQVVMMKAGLYIEVLNDTDKGIALIKQAAADYPQSSVAQHSTEIIKRIQSMKSPPSPASNANAALKVGNEFPDFSVKDTAGRTQSPAALKGKVVLVDFWATWCGPCVNELPHVTAAYKKYHDKGFEIIAISLDRDKSALDSFVRNNEIPWAQIFDSRGDLARKYGIQAIPSTYLLDKEGKIVALDLRGDDLENQLAKLLK